ncbi:WS/DGAT domain-containing protein [Skermania piniformis]|uniref:DUF1298 domain-containing protein n=1 Tax=Skermania pinensis TaxID=39122 RepID=A0ABX8S5Y3_9ACTN|nr:WS/DGAT domain-containing protein [Skermania piniformis]QXQ12866.1 DUF1298 domain-containing protein [Skermania piniformis]
MHDLIRARLSVGDAANYLISTPERVTDWVAYWVFDNGPAGPPSTAVLTAVLDERQQYLTALQRHVVDVPRGVGNPYWVADDTPLRERLTVRTDTVEASTALAAVAATFDNPLDLHETPVRLTAFPDVRDAATGGSQTFVFAQVSHALLVGAHIAGLSQALFAPDPLPLQIQGAGTPTARPRPLAVSALGAARLPVEIARWLILQARANIVAARRAPLPPEMTEPRAATAFNSPRAGTELAVRIVRVDLTAARGKGVTLSVIGLTAVSLAMQRYLESIGAPCPDDLAAMVPVALDHQCLGVNQLTALRADLCPTVADPVERAKAVQTSLQTARAAVDQVSPVELAAGAATPFAIMPRLLPRGDQNDGATAPWATVLTSVRTGSKPTWSLAGRSHIFGGTLANIAPDVGLFHSFASDHSGMTVTLIASGSAVASVDGYAAFLERAFLEVVDAMSASTVATPDRARVEQLV